MNHSSFKTKCEEDTVISEEILTGCTIDCRQETEHLYKKQLNISSVNNNKRDWCLLQRIPHNRLSIVEYSVVLLEYRIKRKTYLHRRGNCEY